jgi:hypothetical protein
MSDLTHLAATCKHLHAQLDALNPHKNHGLGLLAWRLHHQRWAHISVRLSPVQSAAPNLTNQPHLAMLYNMLLHFSSEYRHMQAALPLVRTLQRMPKGSILGLVGNVGKFPTLEIAKAVSQRRRSAMLSVIVANFDASLRFRSLRTSQFVGAVSFVFVPPVLTDLSPPRPPINALGFVGYALDLLELRPEEEHLRETVLGSFMCASQTLTAKTLANAFTQQIPRHDGLDNLGGMSNRHADWHVRPIQRPALLRGAGHGPHS